MNRLEQQAPSNPWEDRASLPRPHTAWVVASAMAVLLSALQLAFFDAPVLAWITLPVLFVYVAVVVRIPGAVILLLAGAVGASALGGSLLVGALFLAVAVGGGSLAWLLSARRIAWSLGALGAAFLIAALVRWDPLTALIVFALLPLGYCFSYATTTGRGRTAVICAGSAGILIAVLAIAAVAFYRLHGTLTLDAVKHSITGTKWYLTDLLNSLRESMIASAEELAAESADMAEWAEQVKELYGQYFSTQMNRSYVDALFALVPALLLVGCNLLSFAAQLVLWMTYRSIGWSRVITSENSRLTVSVTASVIYYICFVITLIYGTFGGLGSIAVVALNALIVLLPILCLKGGFSLATRIRRASPGIKILIILLCLFLLCSGISAFLFLALWGANTVIAEALQKKIEEKKNQLPK